MENSNTEEVLAIPDKVQRYTDTEILVKLFNSPRMIFRYISKHPYNEHIILLTCLGGIVRAIDMASIQNKGDKMDLISILMLSIFGGAVFGWIYFYLAAALINWSGKFLKAKGSSDSIRIILVYAMVPNIISLLFLIPQLLIYGNELFKENGNYESDSITINIIFYTAVLIEFALFIWSHCLLVIGISEVQQLSIFKAIINLLIPLLLIAGAVIAIVYPIYLSHQ